MVLSGWKEIAQYLRCGVRTVQRWERKGLPIMRPIPGSRTHVIAYSQQLDQWLKRSDHRFPEMADIQSKIERTQELLLTLSRRRQEMRLRLDELRKELASLHATHRKH